MEKSVLKTDLSAAPSAPVEMTHGYRQVVIISDDRRAISGFSILLRYQPSNCCLSLIENAFLQDALVMAISYCNYRNSGNEIKLDYGAGSNKGVDCSGLVR